MPKDSKTVETPVPTFKEDLVDKPIKDGSVSNYLSQEKGTALHPKESEFEAYMRVSNRIFGQMLPWKQEYDIEAQQVQDAFEGIMTLSNGNKSQIFPFVFMFVDAKLSAIMATVPRVVFDTELEKAKLPMIEKMYDYYTHDVDDGIDVDSVDYVWHLYNELYGWSAKRVWWELDMQIDHEPRVARDEDTDKIIYDVDGQAKIEYDRRQFIKGRVKQRVYKPDMVAFTPRTMFLHECFDVVFFEDMDFDEWSQKYLNNKGFENTEKVRPGQYYSFNPANVVGEDTTTSQLVLYDHSIGLDTDKVRIEEYYSLARDEYYVKFNGHKGKHIPNPTPPVNGKKRLPVALLQNRPRPGCIYWKPEGKLVEPIIVIWQRLLSATSKRAELAASPAVATDQVSSFSPKSFKVVPGAHFRGMKGRIEVINLAGSDTTLQVDKVIDQLQNLSKSVTGTDFDRFFAEPDPTAQQGMMREAAVKMRTDKDVTRQERMGHVQAAELEVAHLLFYTPIPEIAMLNDLTDEEREDLQDFDIIDDNTYYKYPKIPVKDILYVENYIEKDDKVDLIPYLGTKEQRKSGMKAKAKPYFFARQEFLRTKAPVKVRVISSRKAATNQALKRVDATDIMDRAFGMEPKNQFEIEKAVANQKPPPEPIYYIDRTKAVAQYLDSLGQDVDDLTTPSSEGELKGKPAQKLMEEVFGGRAPRLTVKPENRPKPTDALLGEEAGVPLEQKEQDAPLPTTP